MKFVIPAFAFIALVASVTAESQFVNDVRQNFASNINDEIVTQIRLELLASYVYQSYASFFGRADIALPGFRKFFSEASKEERQHAQKLIDYINMRGGHVQFDTLDLSEACNTIANRDVVKTSPRIRPCICEFVWTKSANECDADLEKEYGLQAMEDALELERYVNEKLLALHSEADTVKDAHLAHILEHDFLEEQVNSIRELAGYVTRLRSFQSNNYALGEYMFDQKLQ